MRAVAVLLSFVASSLAYSVLTPNALNGWTNQGSQNLTWQRVSTDPLNFTVVLSNQHLAGFVEQVLAALVDGTSGATHVNPHNGGWPTGSGFRVNLVKDDDNLDAILAQSPEFNITEVNSTSSTGGTGTASFSFITATSTPTTQTDTSATSPTDATTIPTSGAAASYPVQTGLLTLFSLLGFALAQ